MRLRAFIAILAVLFIVGAAPAMAEAAASPADAAIREGVEYLKQRNPKAAIGPLQKAVTQDPKSAEAHFYLGFAYALNNDPDAARKELGIVLQLDPDNKRARELLATLDRSERSYMSKNQSALDHFNKAETLFQAAKYKESIPEYEAAAAADPKFAKPWVFLGDAYMALHDNDKAIASYKKAIAVDPSDPQPWHFMGDVYEQQYDQTHDVKMLDLAIEAYKQAVKLDSTYQAAAEKLQHATQKRAALPQ